jgi:hypothetical protein
MTWKDYLLAGIMLAALLLGFTTIYLWAWILAG